MGMVRNVTTVDGIGVTDKNEKGIYYYYQCPTDTVSPIASYIFKADAIRILWRNNREKFHQFFPNEPVLTK